MALVLTVIEPKDGLLGAESSMLFGEDGGCIGRARDNDWVLPDPLRYLSSYHARVRCRDGAYFIEDTSSNGVFLNNSRRPLGKSSSPRLRPGDRLRIGAYQIAVTFDDAEQPADSVMHDPAAALLLDPIIAEAPAATAPVAIQTAGPVRDRRQVPRQTAGSSPDLQAFCRGAGLNSSQLPPSAHFNAMYIAGLMLRESVAGARALAESRRELLRVAGTPIAAEEGERLALSRMSIEELLVCFLAGDEAHRVDAVQWLREHFDSSKRHDLRFMPALRSALAEFVHRLEPQALSASGAPAERFRNLTEMPSGELPVLFAEALTRHLQGK
jgi:predicted component of type VI protein secretion system